MQINFIIATYFSLHRAMKKNEAIAIKKCPSNAMDQQLLFDQTGFR
jgi:hypothetical protein